MLCRHSNIQSIKKCPSYYDMQHRIDKINIFLFLFFLNRFLGLIVLYLVGDFIYTVGYKKYGRRDRVPNSSHWFQLPGLVKVGLQQTLDE